MLVLAGALLLLGACIPSPWPPGAPGPRAQGPFARSPGTPTINRLPVDAPVTAPGPVWRKTVSAKQPPERLLAADGTFCTVSEERYARTEIGYAVWCIWQDPES